MNKKYSMYFKFSMFSYISIFLGNLCSLKNQPYLICDIHRHIYKSNVLAISLKEKVLYTGIVKLGGHYKCPWCYSERMRCHGRRKDGGPRDELSRSCASAGADRRGSWRWLYTIPKTHPSRRRPPLCSKVSLPPTGSTKLQNLLQQRSYVWCSKSFLLF